MILWDLKAAILYAYALDSLFSQVLITKGFAIQIISFHVARFASQVQPPVFTSNLQ